MLTKFVVAFGILALVATVAVAGSIPAKGPTYQVTLTEAATVNGTALKAGDYRVTVNADKVVFVMNKVSNEFAAKVQNGEKKFGTNQVQYQHVDKQTTIKEICLGGTKTKLIFN